MVIDARIIVDQYIQLCSRLCKKPSDYTKEGVKAHNKAMTERLKLLDEIRNKAELQSAVYLALLSHDDPYVRQTAATDCLELGIYTARAVKILKQAARSDNPMTAMGAKRTLRIWRGELNPNEPD